MSFKISRHKKPIGQESSPFLESVFTKTAIQTPAPGSDLQKVISSQNVCYAIVAIHPPLNTWHQPKFKGIKQ